jgi:cupin superfamily acireductone dioxygenase involved in methionine salvage
MEMVCIKNDSKRGLEVGKTYFVSYHENSEIYWVREKEDSSTTIQCYKSDFITIPEYRDMKIKKILS